jgi:hypothetical protein
MNIVSDDLKVMIPFSFPDIDLLVVGTKLKPDKVRILLHQMYISRLRLIGIKKKELSFRTNRAYKEGYVPLNANHLKSLLGDRYKLYIEFLCYKELLFKRKSFFSDATYRPGEMSIQFMFNPKLMNSNRSLRNFRKESISDKTTIKSIRRELAKRKLSNRISKRSVEPNGVHLELLKMEKSIKFYSNAAEAWAIKYLETNPSILNIEDKIRNDLDQIESVNEGFFSFKIDCFGERIHTPIKTISKRMRPFMYFDNSECADIISIDICNSQLYFAHALLNPSIVDLIIPEFSVINKFISKFVEEEDIKRFIELTTNGTIYSSWQEIRGLETRNQAKNELFQILFSKSKSRFSGKKEFQFLYPSVWKCFEFIKSLTDKELDFIPFTYVNKKGRYSDDLFHKNLSCALQRLESRIFIKIICKELLNNGIKPFITIHDSILTFSNNQSFVETIINDSFIKLGTSPPKYKIKSNKIADLE